VIALSRSAYRLPCDPIGFENTTGKHNMPPTDNPLLTRRPYKVGGGEKWVDFSGIFSLLKKRLMKDFFDSRGKTDQNFS
jgi:hypothetical protein